MSREAVTRRMEELNQLWELAIALQSSDLANSKPVEPVAMETAPPEKQKSESN